MPSMRPRLCKGGEAEGGGAGEESEKVSRGLGEGSVARHLGECRGEERRGERTRNIILEVASGA